ncbi:MAG: hypothetical protein AAF682_23075 [Planctomycetota bacterium]
MRPHPLLLALPLLASPLAAQSFEELLRVGDVVPGVGLVEEITYVAASDASWMASVNGAGTPWAILLDGQEYQSQGEPIGASGIAAPEFFSFSLGPAGHVILLFPFSFEPGRLFLDKQLVLATGDLSLAPELPAGTVYSKFVAAKTDGLGRLFHRTSTSAPGVFLTFVRAEPGPGGPPASEAVLLQNNDVMPGQTKGLYMIAEGPENFAVNDAGDLIFLGSLIPGGLDDEVIYFNDVLLAQKGAASPLGAPWLDLDLHPGVDLNASGDFAYRGDVDLGGGGVDLIVKNDAQLLIREGAVLADIAPHALGPLTGGPLFVTDAGRVFWYGVWGAPDAPTSGFFLDDELILEAGVDTLNGVRITALEASRLRATYAVSNGGKLVFYAELEDGTRGLFRVDLADFVPAQVAPMSDCGANPGTLVAAGGAPSPGATLTLALDGAQAAGALAFLALADDAAAGWPPCGPLVPGLGELLLDLSAPGPWVSAGGAWGGAALAVDVDFPAQEGLLGLTLFAQGLFLDAAPAAPEPLRLTGGLALTLGV